MKFISVHADFVEFQAKKKALKTAPEVDTDLHRVEECLVVLTAVEKRDEKNVEGVAKRYAKEIVDIASQVNATKIVLYPYAHLSSSLGSPKTAMEVMAKGEELLVASGLEVEKAPFGWYKSFDLKCKGHPLSELSRSFGPEDSKEEVSEALKKEETLKSSWYILDVDGKMHPISKEGNDVKGFDFSENPNLYKLCLYELAKSRAVDQEPPHVKYMKKLELVDYEPGSDPGHLRYYPKGRLIKSLIEEATNQAVLEYGAMEIEAPIMYDMEHPSLKSYMHRFPARQYAIQTPNKRTFLRFAACFGQFLMAHDMNISYKDLPVRLYELTKYSFRVEQRGELTGMRRLRAFTMPDCHAFVADIKMALEEMKRRFETSKVLQESMGLTLKDDFELAMRVVQETYDENKDLINSIVSDFGKPALLEVWNDRFFYFCFKYEWNFIDALGKASTLTTDQIDVENAERYDINYVDSDGEKKKPIILHWSPSGAVERVFFALLEKASFDEKAGKAPMLPVWCSPTQVRVIPVSVDKFGEFAEELAEQFTKYNVRCDIDDRADSVGKRIRQSATEWVPYTLVVGDKEKDSGKFIVRRRDNGQEVEMTLEELLEELKTMCNGMPYKPLPLPRHLSKRPVFVG